MKTLKRFVSDYDLKNNNSRLARYSRVRRILERHLFSVGPVDEPRLGRVLARVRELVKTLSVPQPKASTGPFSGLTQAELRATGTCETDWF